VVLLLTFLFLSIQFRLRLNVVKKSECPTHSGTPIKAPLSKSAGGTVCSARAEQLSVLIEYQHLQCFKYIPISNNSQSIANTDIHNCRIVNPTERRFIDVGLKKIIVQSLFSFHFISTQTIFKPHSNTIQSLFSFLFISTQIPFMLY
jgi:hypothetical protein